MLYCRGIEWSLRAFASMRAVRVFLRARAAISFVMRAASTLEITNGEQRGLRNRNFAPSNLADTFKAGQYVKILPLPAAYSQLCLVLYAV